MEMPTFRDKAVAKTKAEAVARDKAEAEAKTRAKVEKLKKTKQAEVSTLLLALTLQLPDVSAPEPSAVANFLEPAPDAMGTKGIYLGLRPHVDKGKGKDHRALSRKISAANVDKGKDLACDKLLKKHDTLLLLGIDLSRLLLWPPSPC